jgi:hypothetical protein
VIALRDLVSGGKDAVHLCLYFGGGKGVLVRPFDVLGRHAGDAGHGGSVMMIDGVWVPAPRSGRITSMAKRPSEQR